MYIGILCILPFLQKMVSVFDKKDFKYFIFLTIFVLGTIPLLNHYFVNFDISGHVKAVIFNTNIGLFIAGFYIHKIIKPNKKVAIYSACVYLFLLLFQIFAIYSEYGKLGNDAYVFYDNRVMITITLSSLILFYLAKYIFTFCHIPEKLTKTIKFLSGYTFGIYLISDFYIHKFGFIQTDLSEVVNPIIAALILQLLVFSAGLLTTIVLKKIPYFNKLI